jgi:hypothetical protein
MSTEKSTKYLGVCTSSLLEAIIYMWITVKQGQKGSNMMKTVIICYWSPYDRQETTQVN